MKVFMKEKGFVVVSSLILLIVFVFGGIYSRFMTSQIDVHAQDAYEQSLVEMVNEGSTLVAFESNGSDATYIRETTGEEYTPDLIESYKVLNDNNEEIAYVYVIETKGCSEGLRAAYAISSLNDHLLDVQVISHNESTSFEGLYYNLVTDEFFDRFVDKDMDVVDFSIDTLAGATYSSMAFDSGMKYARELYANDTDFEIINLVLTIDDVRYNHDLSTLADYPFIIDITFGLDSKTATIALNNDLEYVSTLAGETPTALEIEAFPSFVVEADALNIHHITVDYYNEATRTVRITTRGFSMPGITIDVVLNETFTHVEQVNFVSSNESYDSGYNNLYSGGDNPAVENQFIDQYNDDETIIDAIAGATVTSNAITSALGWVEDLEIAMNGGN
jgi:Na+-translocating ferredoxin:NAD+ oxidoreductase RnfG subunit